MTESDSKVIAPAMQTKKYTTKRLTTAEFVARAKDKHGGEYDYHLVNYINMSTKVWIVCKHHGKFLQTPHEHLKGSGCRDCGYAKARLKTTSSFEDFKSKADEVHKKYYSYKDTVWDESKGNKQKIKITCPKHGVFLQIVSNHTGGAGCPKCKAEATSQAKIKSTEKFIVESVGVHGDCYDYSEVEYRGNKIPVKIKCQKHGFFEQVPSSHLNGSGCFECFGKRRHPVELVLNRFKAAHGDRYDYSQMIYKGWQFKIKIVCKEHGVFEQVAGKHASGAGCGGCIETRGWAKSDYMKLCESRHNGMSNLYLIECFNDDESFYKIGMSVDVKRRFIGSTLPYKYKIILVIKENAGFVWDMERRLHAMLRKYKHKPKIPFEGDTECFTQIPNKVFRFLENIKNSNQLPLIA